MGKTVRIRVSKRPGKEKISLLSDSENSNQNIISNIIGSSDEEESTLWSSIAKFVFFQFLLQSFKFSSLVGGEKYEKINIFSLASGHLYERFMRIMMLSVTKNTKHNVKFWLLNNYLSPYFRVLLL